MEIKIKINKKKIIISAIVILVSFGIGWVVGNRITPRDYHDHAEDARVILDIADVTLDELTGFITIQGEQLHDVLSELRGAIEYGDELEGRLERADDLAGRARSAVSDIRLTAGNIGTTSNDIRDTVRLLQDNHRRITGRAIELENYIIELESETSFR